MILSFLESLKYTGHLYPVALLRIFMGYFYLETGLTRLQGAFLKEPHLAAAIMEATPQANMTSIYVQFLQDFVAPHWQIFAYALTYCELVLGVCLLIGFLVRPATLVGLFIALQFIYFGTAESLLLHQTQFIVLFVLFWLGAGRCLGFDYYFYKRVRGLWW